MGSCNRRHFLLSISLLQLLTIIERQVFDFLGYMWAPIIVNFFHIIFVIFGFYGAYHLRAKYIITYIIWSFIWIGWNAFVICFYLNIGILNNENSDLLDFGTGSYSWFLANGPGCKPSLPTNLTNEDPSSLYRPSVENCILDYQLVEIIHSGVQCILAVLAIIGSILLCYIFLEEDDQFDFMGGDAQSPQHTIVQPMYVSYTSLPTSNSTSKINQNTNSFRINNSNKYLNNSKNTITTTASSCNENTIISSKYYDDSTATAERYFHNGRHQHQPLNDSTSTATMNSRNYTNNNNTTVSSNFSTFLGPTSVQQNNQRPNVKYTKVGQAEDTFVHRDNSQFFQNDGYENYEYTLPINSIPEDSDNLNFITKFNRSGHSEYPDLSPDVIETYSMPFQPAVPASPTPSRMSIRRRQDKSNLANLYDRIINAPTQFADSSGGVGIVARRSLSRDQLNFPTINSENGPRSRPRSYCNNNNNSHNIHMKNNNG